MSDESKTPGSKPAHHPSPVTRHPPQGTVLAFDFGEKRIGVAVGDTETRLAHPLTTIREEGNRERFAAIAALITEWRPAVLVVGLPAHADGTEHEVSRLCRRFAQRLEGRFGIPTLLVDERLTSRAAASTLREAGVRGPRAGLLIDQVAAKEILAAYFSTPPLMGGGEKAANVIP